MNGEQQPPKVVKSGILGACGNFVNSIIGGTVPRHTTLTLTHTPHSLTHLRAHTAGIIGLPYALREAGFLAGVLMLVGVGYATFYSVSLLVHSARNAHAHHPLLALKLSSQRDHVLLLLHLAGQDGVATKALHIRGAGRARVWTRRLLLSRRVHVDIRLRSHAGLVSSEIAISTPCRSFHIDSHTRSLIIIGDTVGLVLTHWTGTAVSGLSRRFIIFGVALVFILPLSL